MKKLLLFCMLLSGCNEYESTYDGTRCHKAIENYCGVHIWQCENGKEYICVTNFAGVEQ
jgi:hypothetical protein